jgi:hypothetical protein
LYALSADTDECSASEEVAAGRSLPHEGAPRCAITREHQHQEALDVAELAGDRQGRASSLPRFSSRQLFSDFGRGLHQLERTIKVVSIAKKGPRTPAETARERDPLFRHAQAFRAGIEGTISFLKRVLRLARCSNKSWKHFVATVGQTIFAHNMLVLARA